MVNQMASWGNVSGTLHPLCPFIHVYFEPSGTVAAPPAMHGSPLIFNPPSIWPGQCPDTRVPFQPSPQMMPPAGTGAELAASRAHGNHGQTSAFDTMPTFPFVLSLFISVLDLHSHQRTAPKAAEVTAKLRELPVFKSPLVQAGQVSSVLFSHWNVLCEGEVTGGLSQRSSVSAYLLMEISFPTPLFFFWVKVAYLFMTGSRGRRLHLVEKSMTQPWQIQPSVTGMVSCYLCLGFRNRFPATGERFR